MLFNLLADATTQGDGNNIGTLIIFGVMIVAIIGLFVWQSINGKKKQKEAQNMVNSLKVGDKVKTIGGVCGYVAEIDNEENTFVLETGTNSVKSYVKFDKGAIYQTAPAKSTANDIKPKQAEASKEEVKSETSEKAE